LAPALGGGKWRLKIAQPFKAGFKVRWIFPIPTGTKETFFRPCRDFSPTRREQPSLKRLGYFQRLVLSAAAALDNRPEMNPEGIQIIQPRVARPALPWGHIPESISTL